MAVAIPGVTGMVITEDMVATADIEPAAYATGSVSCSAGYAFQRRSLSALPTTKTLESAMAPAAKTGDSSTP